MRSLCVLACLALLSCSSTTGPAGGGAIGGGGTGSLYFGMSADVELHKLDLATGRDTKLGAGEAPCKTKEGTLVFTTPLDLAESAEDLATHRIIVKGDPDLERSNNGFHAPQVSPDGTKVAYTTNDENMYVAARADGKILARFEAKGATDGWYRPTWTPDGRIVAAGGFGNPGLFVSDAGLTTMKRFDPMLAQPESPAVSPDGTTVAFVLNRHLYVIGIDGTGMKRIDPSDDEDAQPTWSPDGSKLVYRVFGHLKIIPAEGGAATDLFDLFPALQDQLLVISGTEPLDWK